MKNNNKYYSSYEDIEMDCCWCGLHHEVTIIRATGKQVYETGNCIKALGSELNRLKLKKISQAAK